MKSLLILTGVALFSTTSLALAAETQSVRIYNDTNEYLCEISVEPTGEYWAEKCTEPGTARTVLISRPGVSCMVDIHLSFDDVGESNYRFDLCSKTNLHVDSIHTYYD